MLEVYYQLYTRGKDTGDMPDIAVKRKGGEFLLVLDPKYGMSYDRGELSSLAQRYARAFLADLTVIHNFYPMPYSYEVVSEKPRCLLVSNVRPDTDSLSRFDHDIISLVPDSWLPEGESIVILVDTSGSTEPVQDRMIKGVDAVLHSLSRPSVSSVLVLFADKVVDEIPLSDVHHVGDLIGKSSRGETNLTGALQTGIERLKGKRRPRSLLIFTDGKGTLDIAPMGQMIRSAELQLRIHEIVDSDGETPLQRLAQTCGGQYQRI